MQKQDLKRVTIITAEPKHYLALAKHEDSEMVIGKPVRIIFDNSGVIPELEEREV